MTYGAAHFTARYQALSSNQWLRREHPRFIITGRLPSHVTMYGFEETLRGSSLASDWRVRGDTLTEGAPEFGANFLVPFKLFLIVRGKVSFDDVSVKCCMQNRNGRQIIFEPPEYRSDSCI